MVSPESCPPLVPAVRVSIVLNGRLAWVIPELGLRHIPAGHWCLVADSRARHQPTGEGLEVVCLGLASAQIEELRCHGLALPPALACVFCPRREVAVAASGPACPRLLALAEGLNKPKATSVEGFFRHQAAVAELWSLVFARPELQVANACRDQGCAREAAALEAVAADLRAHLPDEHHLPTLARRHHLNECDLKRGFKARFGQTVFGYLRHARMERARALLEARQGSVLAVANAVGYSNASHFARAFREVHGFNPGDLA